MNPSECPDSTVWYNPDYGEATAGEIRTVVQEDPLETTFRYWGWMCTRNLRFGPDGEQLGLKKKK